MGERGLDGIPMEGMLVEMDRGGVGFLHIEKDNQLAYCLYSYKNLTSCARWAFSCMTWVKWAATSYYPNDHRDIHVECL